MYILHTVAVKKVTGVVLHSLECKLMTDLCTLATAAAGTCALSSSIKIGSEGGGRTVLNMVWIAKRLS